jgi:extradiol dioxygenase family protein
MDERHIFHLSIPVTELAPAKRFYVEVLGASTGRENDEWLDILLWGHQITLQRRPEEVVPLERQGKRHFGVILPWTEWEDQAARIRALGVLFLSEPGVLLSGTSEEQAKFYLQDPSNNIIEVKAYRNLADTVGIGSADSIFEPEKALQRHLARAERGAEAMAPESTTELPTPIFVEGSG